MEYKITEIELPVLNEPMAMYSFLSHTDITTAYINILDKIVGVTDEIIAKWLNVTTRTLRNYKIKETSLKESTQEHIVAILSLYKHGKEAFGSHSLFEKWLLTPNYLLDLKAPSDFLDTISGINLIDNRLTAMEFGENV